jgi:hypothetical protein
MKKNTRFWIDIHLSILFFLGFFGQGREFVWVVPAEDRNPKSLVFIKCDFSVSIWYAVFFFY